MDETRPAPVVTVVDPRRSTAPVEVLEPAERTPLLRPRERLLVVGLALLLLAGLTSTGRVRQQLVQQRQLAALDLRATLGGGVANQGGSVTARVLLFAGDGTSVDVSGVSADNGWAPVGSAVTSVADGSLAVLAITHELTCQEEVRRPTRLSLTARVPSGGSRPLQLPIALPVEGVIQAVREICGDVDASDAVLFTAGGLLRRGARTELDLQLANRGLDAVRVLGARYPGFAVTGRGLSLTGRRAGLLDVSDLPAGMLALSASVADCALADDAIDRAGATDRPDQLVLEVDGRGGRALAYVDVPGLLAYLEASRVETCA